MPSVVECNFETGENRVLEYVELSDAEFDKQIIQPLAEMFVDILNRDIESGRFDEIMKDYHGGE
jgi:hypothetical protein